MECATVVIGNISGLSQLYPISAVVGSTEPMYMEEKGENLCMQKSRCDLNNSAVAVTCSTLMRPLQ